MCPASGKISPNQPDTFQIINAAHNHLESHADTIRVLAAKTNLRNRVKIPLCMKSHAYLEELAKLPDELRPIFGSYKKVGSGLRKLKMKSFPKCTNFAELDRLLTQNVGIREQFARIDGNPFYRKYFNDGTNDALLFLNQAAVDEATINDMILVDGTFRARPLKCAQILVIFRLIAGAVSYCTMKPVTTPFRVYFFQPWLFGLALMNSRKKSLYQLIFQYIKNECTAIPEVFMSDYEQGMRKAAKEVWPSVETPGCAFHYRQAIRRSYQQKVKHKPPKLSPEAAAHAMVRRMVMNLQFLPARLIFAGARFIEQYQRQQGVLRSFKEFNKYHKKYWLETVKPSDFTMFEREHRTNNICESFNAKLNRNIQRSPNIYTFLHCVRLLFVESNQNHGEPYEVRSAMSQNLEMAWQALNNGNIQMGEFIALNFYDRNLQL